MLLTRLPCVEWCYRISVLQHRLILYILFLRQSAAKNVSRMKGFYCKRTSWLGQGSSWEPPWCKSSWWGSTAQSGCCGSQDRGITMLLSSLFQSGPWGCQQALLPCAALPGPSSTHPVPAGHRDAFWLSPPVLAWAVLPGCYAPTCALTLWLDLKLPYHYALAWGSGLWLTLAVATGPAQFPWGAASLAGGCCPAVTLGPACPSLAKQASLSPPWLCHPHQLQPVQRSTQASNPRASKGEIIIVVFQMHSSS